MNVQLNTNYLNEGGEGQASASSASQRSGSISLDDGRESIVEHANVGQVGNARPPADFDQIEGQPPREPRSLNHRNLRMNPASGGLWGAFKRGVRLGARILQDFPQSFVVAPVVFGASIIAALGFHIRARLQGASIHRADAHRPLSTDAPLQDESDQEKEGVPNEYVSPAPFAPNARPNAAVDGPRWTYQ